MTATAQIVNQSNISLYKTSKDFIFKKGSKEVIQYRYTITDSPKGVDERYKKSGYIHPLFAPDGTRLTRIQPEDHYHHYGIWGPWTHTQVEGKRVDFWNLKEGQGTVLFDSVKTVNVTDEYTELVVAQKHLVLPSELEAIKEELSIKVWNSNKDIFIVDYTTTISTTLEDGVLLEQYRYGGGIGFRATEKWHTDNSDALTSEGFTRKDADATNAKWCMLFGPGDKEEQVGVLFLSHKNNQAHPEPMRMWPADQYKGKSNVFFEFCPIRHEEWKLKPNQKYQLKYRMVVFTGDLDAESAENHWKKFNP